MIRGKPIFNNFSRDSTNYCIRRNILRYNSSGSDHGTLDVSDQLEDGEIRGYFQPYEQPTPTPEPAPEPDPESENAENAEEPPTE